MSFRKKTYTDEQAVSYFINHAIVSVLSNESSNALVLLLTLPEGMESPYRQLVDGIDTIQRMDVRRLVLKLSPLGSLPPILVENQIINVTEQTAWSKEIHFQKRIFHTTYMIDMQLQAICPNSLASWIIEPSHHTTFLNSLAFVHGEPKRKFTYWEYGERRERIALDADWLDRPTTHIATIYSFFQHVKQRGLDVGCMLMEYLSNAKDMLEYACTNRNNLSEKRPDAFGTWDEYNQYLYGKAYGLIQYDKLGAIGYSHGDSHWGNFVTYETPNEMVTAIIDFGMTSESTRQCHLTMRARPFNDLDSDQEPYQPFVYSKRRAYSYVQDCLIQDDKISEWNHVSQKKPQRLSKHSYTYIPIDLMNQIDAYMVQRGRRIRDLLIRHVARYTNQPVQVTGLELLAMYLESIKSEENCTSLLENVPVCLAFSTLPLSKRSRRPVSSKHKRRSRRVRRSEPIG